MLWFRPLSCWNLDRQCLDVLSSSRYLHVPMVIVVSVVLEGLDVVILEIGDNLLAMSLERHCQHFFKGRADCSDLRS